MLTFLRKKMKIIFIIILLGIIPAFTLWGIGSIFRTPKKDVAGEINGRKIYGNEYREAYMSVYWDSQLTGRNISADEINDTAWTRLILLDEAKKCRLDVSDEEVANRIGRFFGRDGKFDEKFYIEVLTRNNISPSAYEDQTKKTLLIEKLRDLILDGIKISDSDTYQQYLLDNETLTINYAVFNYTDYLSKITPKEEDIIAYFEEHKDAYKKPEEVNTKYIESKISGYAKDIKITDNDAKEYFNEHGDEFKQEKQVKASHILLKVNEGAPKDQEEKIKTRANELLAKAKAGEDFAELAKKNSECPSAPKGGDLGFFGTGSMVKPFEEAAFKLKTGEICPELVKTQFGYHIIKATEIKEAKEQTFDEVKTKIIENLTKEKAEAKAREVIEECYYKSEDLESLKKAAEAAGLELKETGFFSTSNIPGIGVSSEYYDQAFKMDLFKVSEIVKTDNGFYLFAKIDKREGVIPELKEVRVQVESNYKNDKTKDMALKDAKDALAKIKQTMEKDKKSFSEAATQAGLTSKISQPFTISAPDPDLGFGIDLGNTLFSLKSGAVSEPIETTSSIIIAEAKEYVTPDIKKFEAAKKNIESQIAMQKKYMVFQEWMNAVKKNAKLIDLTKYAHGIKESDNETPADSTAQSEDMGIEP